MLIETASALLFGVENEETPPPSLRPLPNSLRGGERIRAHQRFPARVRVDDRTAGSMNTASGPFPVNANRSEESPSLISEAP
jgi:hypothetical protein